MITIPLQYPRVNAHLPTRIMCTLAPCRWTVGRQSADCRPTVNRQSTDRQPIVYRQSADSWPIGQLTVGRHFVTDSRPTVSGEDDRLYDNEDDLESWCWQEKELTVSCTSCEDERNALCATKKATDGILGLDRFANLIGKNWKPSSQPKDDHSATMPSLVSLKAGMFSMDIVLQCLPAVVDSWQNSKHFRSILVALVLFSETFPNPVESGVWVSPTMKRRTCFILEMVLKDFWWKPTCRQSVELSADCVSTDSRSIVCRYMYM